VVCQQPCPQGWKIFFFDAAGQLILNGAPENLSNYLVEVPVPASAVRAQIGYRDDESFQTNCVARGKCCTTGQTCAQADIYFDNEGLRAPPFSQSTNGCQFTFRHLRTICQ
jgi:hypothetical protein